MPSPALDKKPQPSFSTQQIGSYPPSADPTLSLLSHSLSLSLAFILNSVYFISEGQFEGGTLGEFVAGAGGLGASEE